MNPRKSKIVSLNKGRVGHSRSLVEHFQPCSDVRWRLEVYSAVLATQLVQRWLYCSHCRSDRQTVLLSAKLGGTQSLEFDSLRFWSPKAQNSAGSVLELMARRAARVLFSQFFCWWGAAVLNFEPAIQKDTDRQVATPPPLLKPETRGCTSTISSPGNKNKITNMFKLSSRS